MNFYNFHIGDFRSGSANLSRIERWIYRDMLDFYYDKEKPLPLDFDLLCDEIGVSEEQEKKAVSKILRVKFIKNENGYLNARCEKEISRYHEKALISIQNGRKGGRRRADTKPVDNPAVTQQVDSGNPDISESQANQEPRTINHNKEESKTNTPRKKRVDVSFDARQWLLDRGATPQHADDWLKVRKEKKGANTLTAFEHVEREAVAAGLSIDQVAEMCARKPWCGFESKWVLEAAKSYGQGPPHGKPEKFDATQWVNRNRTNWEPQ